MTAPTPGLMSILERSQVQLLTQSGQAYRRSKTSDGMGGQVAGARVLVHEDLPVRLAGVRSAREREIAEKLEVVAPQVMVVSKLYPLNNGDTVEIGGKTYRVALLIPGGLYSVVDRYIVNEV